MSNSLLEAFLTERSAKLESKREVFIAIRRDGGLGADGTFENPLDGSSASKLDAILRLDPSNPYAQSNTRFIFGHGIFETEGGNGSNRGDNDFSWRPLPGCEYIGSGMHTTVLRLKMAPGNVTTGAGYGAISSRLRTNGLVIADMTIDCNIDGQPPSVADTRPGAFKPAYPFAAAGFGAINLFGDNITIRRVRVINNGSRYFTFDGFEGIAILIFSYSTTKNLRIENCILERPYENLARETVFIALEYLGPHVSCVIRNNYLDGAFLNPGPFSPLPVRSLYMTGTEGILETFSQHDMSTSDKVVISGAGSISGTYPVSAVDSQWQLRFSKISTAGPVAWTISAEKFSKPSLLVASLFWSGTTGQMGTATLTTHVPHNRVTGDWITISGTSAGTVYRFDGTFKVSVDPNFPTKMTFPVLDPGSAPLNGVIWLDKSPVNWRMYGFGPSFGPFIPDGGTFNVITTTPHFRKPGQYVHVGYTPNNFAVWDPKQPYGYFKVLDVVSPLELKCGFIDYIDLLDAIVTWDDWTMTDDLVYGSFPGTVVGNDVYAIVPFESDGSLVEGNALYNGTKAVYADLGSNTELSIRNNYLYNIKAGVDFALNPSIHPVRTAAMAVSTAVDQPIKIQKSGHGLLQGQVLKIEAEAQTQRWYANVIDVISTGEFAIDNPLIKTNGVQLVAPGAQASVTYQGAATNGANLKSKTLGCNYFRRFGPGTDFSKMRSESVRIFSSVLSSRR